MSAGARADEQDLVVPSAEGATTSDVPVGRSWRTVAGALGLVVVVGLVVWGAVTAGGSSVGDADAGASDGEEEPVEEDGFEQAPPPEGDGGIAPGHRGEPTCDPEGCELWRVELPVGQAVAAEELIVHVASTPRRLSDQDGGGRPVGTVTVTAVEPLDGRVRWQVDGDVEWDGSIAPLRAVPIGGVVLLPSADGLRALDAGSGAVRWLAPLHLEHVDGGAEIDGDILLMGWSKPGAGDASQPSSGTQRHDPIVARVDPDGQVTWRLDGAHLLGRDGDRLLVGWPEQGRYGAVTADTGDIIWDRDGATGFGMMPTAEGRTVAVAERSAEVLDLATGELLRTVDLDEDPYWPVHLLGPLLVIGPDLNPGMLQGSRTGDLVLLDLADPDAPPRNLEGVSGVVGPEGLHPLLFFQRFAPVGPSSEVPGGLILSQQAGLEVVLTRLDASGQVAWRHEHTLDDAAACCWRVVAGDDPGTFVVVPSDDRPMEVRNVDTGEVVDTFAQPRSVDGDSVSMLWHGTLRWELGGAPGAVAGPAGNFEVPGGIQPVALTPVPVVAVDGTLIALDMERLRGR